MVTLVRASSPCLARVLLLRKLGVGAFSFLSVKRMGNDKLLSTSSASFSSKYSRRNDKRENGSVECTKQSEKSTFKDDKMKGYLEIESFKDEPNRLEAMTVKELRTLMRDNGIPLRGTKQDLLSAIRCFLLKEEHATAGQNAVVPVEKVPSAVKPTLLKNTPSKRRAQGSSMEDNVSVLEVSGTRNKKNKGKVELIGTVSLQKNSKTVVAEQQFSVRTEEVLDVKLSHSIRRVSSKTQSNDVEMLDQLSMTGNSSEPWTMLAHKNPQHGWVAYNPKTMRPPPLSCDTNCVKLMSWNVNGLRALLKLEGFSALELAQKENFDVLCLQETKIQEKDVKGIKHLIDGYDNSFWTCSVSKLGYSGTAIVSRVKPISVKYGLGIKDHDTEGRLLTVEFDTFYLVSGYVPNSGDGLKRLTYRTEEWDPALSNYMKELEKSKPVILTGDLNCAHEEIDIFNPAGNRRSAGFTNEERESFEKNFLSRGFVDTFRKQHPGVVGYTYWGYRHNGRKTNKGWRLDYFLVSESIAGNVHDSYILPDVSGSDHCPVGLILKL